MLYMPKRHLQYAAYSWNEDRVVETIYDILRRTLEGFDSLERLWPIHPNDSREGEPPFSTPFYFGAAGVLWAVGDLSNFNNIHSKLPSIDEVLAFHSRREANFADSPFCGELGIRFVKQVLAPTAENSIELKLLIDRAVSSKCREILFGGPGALAMAHILWRSGDSSYREVCTKASQQILGQRERDAVSGARIWTQKLGTHRQFIGAAHGNVGNFGVLIRVLRDLGEMNAVQELIRDAENFLLSHALVEGDLANWRRGAEGTEYDSLLVVHWCHGATGVVTDLSGCISPAESPVLNDLFLKAANLVWMAGPLAKGSSLCHGTAGSGLACLKMFERLSEEVWLERARGLAMFAIEQYRSTLEKIGQARFSLWTGDLGLAVFLRDVLKQHGTLPGVAPSSSPREMPT